MLEAIISVDLLHARAVNDRILLRLLHPVIETSLQDLQASLLLDHRMTALDYSGNTDAVTALLSLVVFFKDSAPREVTHA